MRIKIAILILIVSVAAIRADQSIESVQQALKEQGFYYGEITGEKNADTTAAIRRFQIRHGLQITGELNEETLRLLGSAPSASPHTIRSASRSISSQFQSAHCDDRFVGRYDCELSAARRSLFRRGHGAVD